MNVASIADNSHYPIIHDTSIMIDDTKRTAGKVGSTTFWKLLNKTVRPQASVIASSTVTTTNTFNVLDNDETYDPIHYKSTWMLDSAAGGVYGDMNTIVRKRKKIKRGSGIKVATADKNSMQQVATGIAPFKTLPLPATKAEIFPKMQSPLLGCGPLVKNDCTIVLERTQASIITGLSQASIKKVLSEGEDDILLTVPFDEHTLTW